ncbi:MAG: hypothetical protein KJZ87_08790 [Thermoguttaceae bacterium]|nr:hypothetical protein [Thermoguttaceae bacterium]
MQPFIFLCQGLILPADDGTWRAAWRWGLGNAGDWEAWKRGTKPPAERRPALGGEIWRRSGGVVWAVVEGG